MKQCIHEFRDLRARQRLRNSSSIIFLHKKIFNYQITVLINSTITTNSLLTFIKISEFSRKIRPIKPSAFRVSSLLQSRSALENRFFTKATTISTQNTFSTLKSPWNTSYRLMNARAAPINRRGEWNVLIHFFFYTNQQI